MGVHRVFEGVRFGVVRKGTQKETTGVLCFGGVLYFETNPYLSGPPTHVSQHQNRFLIESGPKAHKNSEGGRTCLWMCLSSNLDLLKSPGNKGSGENTHS